MLAGMLKIVSELKKWMDDLRFDVLFNTISVIPGDDERLIRKGYEQWNRV